MPKTRKRKGPSGKVGTRRFKNHEFKAAGFDHHREEAMANATLREEIRVAHQNYLALCRKDVNEFIAYVGRDAETGREIEQGRIHEEFQLLADVFPRLVVMAHPESGKAVPLDTEIPTPNGWTTMGDLQVGDPVFGRDGLECEVVWKSPVMHGHTVYRLTFNDGIQLYADADHQWVAKHVDEMKERVVTTQTMIDEGGHWLIPRYRSDGETWYCARWFDQVESVPVQCIQVDSPDQTYLMDRSYTVTHNTTQLAILRMIWLIGRNPNIRIAAVSKTGDVSKKISRACRSYIEKSQEIAEVFPALLPGDKWEEDAWSVQRESAGSKDFTFQALGLGGTIIGSRVDVLIMDDILDASNTQTASERTRTLRRIRSTFLDRLSEDAKVIFLTNAWHPDDPAHEFEKESSWHCARFPVIDEETGEPNWPEKWSLERIESAKEDLGPLEFARAHLCKARDEGESPFEEEAIKAAEARGEEIEVVYQLLPDELPPGAMISTGVDLAITKKNGSHLTALVTLLYWPEDMSRQVLWVEAGRWSSREIRDRVLDHTRRYDPLFVIENNAAQRWIIDIIYNQSDLPEQDRVLPTIVPFTTGKNKAHPQFGVEGIAVEINNGKWIFPQLGPPKTLKEINQLKGDMLYYTRGSHTGDRLMAAWFAREGIRKRTKAGRPEMESQRELGYQGQDPNPRDSQVKVYDSEDMKPKNLHPSVFFP